MFRFFAAMTACLSVCSDTLFAKSSSTAAPHRELCPQPHVFPLSPNASMRAVRNIPYKEYVRGVVARRASAQTARSLQEIKMNAFHKHDLQSDELAYDQTEKPGDISIAALPTQANHDLRGYIPPLEMEEPADNNKMIIGAAVIAMVLGGFGAFSYATGMWNAAAPVMATQSSAPILPAVTAPPVPPPVVAPPQNVVPPTAPAQAAPVQGAPRPHATKRRAAPKGDAPMPPPPVTNSVEPAPSSTVTPVEPAPSVPTPTQAAPDQSAAPSQSSPPASEPPQ